MEEIQIEKYKIKVLVRKNDKKRNRRKLNNLKPLKICKKKHISRLNKQSWVRLKCTIPVCTRSSYPFYIESYYIKCVTSPWTYSIWYNPALEMQSVLLLFSFFQHHIQCCTDTGNKFTWGSDIPASCVIMSQHKCQTLRSTWKPNTKASSLNARIATMSAARLLY